MDISCNICGNIDNNMTHIAREMMFGWREKFTYLECASCGCLQNVEVPSDLGKYYGPSYYSVAPTKSKRSRFYSLLKKIRTQAFLEGTGFFGGLFLSKFGPPGLPKWVKHAAMRQDNSILEVGCGSGALLLSLNRKVSLTLQA